MAVCEESRLTKALQICSGAFLTEQAERRVPVHESCRNWRPLRMTMAVLTFLGLLTLGFAFVPALTFGLLCAWATLTLVLTTALKTAAGILHLRKNPEPETAPLVIARKPIVSIMVPLFKEKEIAEHLLKRLQNIDYPRELLDILLVLEEDDLTTLETIEKTELPQWMRAIRVPAGTLKTKPRALNYALDFCRGSIIGVYDAEGAPARDQINIVINRFAARGPEVACLQGILDFYNADSNWLSRCFTVEYATWFRVMLPGLEKLGLAIPLGGTTLFFRRDVLEKLGGWDAHNVTEDADLDIRLARHGYRTELIPTVTGEEANGRAWPWIKQRSRWLKGYAITYGVHMSRPLALWRDLGAWRFFGVQLLFAGTLSQFILAPVLWSFWLLPLGLPHPLSGVLPTSMFWTLGALFFVSELLGIAVSMLAVHSASHMHLLKWVPTLHLYFPLAAIASYKGIWELMTRPFYWDKTAHGVFTPTRRPPTQPRRRPT
jgi:cellulose synthase/poly-beta-1,6-N-acetylglucosamine synthase-like glycosyltransferase